MSSVKMNLRIDTSEVAEKFRYAAKQLDVVADILAQDNDDEFVNFECSEPAIKPCPFCGADALFIDTWAKCPDDQCAGGVGWSKLLQWNRRSD